MTEVRIVFTRDASGVAWMRAPCGCEQRLLCTQEEREAFLEHSLVARSGDCP